MLEQQIQQGLFSGRQDRAFTDKVLAKEEVDKIRELIKKAKLSREDLLELLYLLSSNESKLLNYGAWDRYVILKYFVWVREFVKVAELLYDYNDDLEKKKKQGKFKLTPTTKQILDNNNRLMEHNVKFLIDLYLNIGRTTLSLGATGFLEFLRQKFEFNYPNLPAATPLTPQENKSGFLGLGRK